MGLAEGASEQKSHGPRYTGEGTLDDSDSSSESPDDGSQQLSVSNIGESRRTSPSPADWHEDEMRSSVSSASSDSDDHGSDHSRASVMPVRASSPSRRSRKTQESLSGSLLLSRKSFDKHESTISIQSANANTFSVNNRSRSGSIITRETSTNLGARRRSQAFSVNSTAQRRSEAHPSVEHEHNTLSAEDLREENLFLFRSDTTIRKSEVNYRMAGWRSLQEEIEVLSDAVSWHPSRVNYVLNCDRVMCKCVQCCPALFQRNYA